MILNGVDLKDFSEEESFGFIDIMTDRIAGIYIIIKKDDVKTSEIVKIGESKSIYSRFANYLSPFRTDKEKESGRRKTKRCFRQKMQEGTINGAKYFYIIKTIDVQKERRDEEKILIKKFIVENRRPPVMNNEKWIENYLSKLGS
jgi:hypothetical protein